MAKKKGPTNPVSDYLAEIGRKGGQVTGVAKGFGAMTPERRKEMGAKGAAARRNNARKKRGPR